MSDKLTDTLEEMDRYSRRWERPKDLDSRYVPPQPVDKMRVLGTAYNTTSTKAKIAPAVVQAARSPQPQPLRAADGK